MKETNLNTYYLIDWLIDLLIAKKLDYYCISEFYDRFQNQNNTPTYSLIFFIQANHISCNCVSTGDDKDILYFNILWPSLELFFPLQLIYSFWERKRVSKGGAKKERERDRERERIPNKLPTVSAEPDAGLELMNSKIMTWAEIKNQMLNQPSHPVAPRTLTEVKKEYI